MNKKEIDIWLKDLEKRNMEDAALREAGEYEYEEYLGLELLYFTVVIPEYVYNLLEEDEQDKFEVCYLSNHICDDYLWDEYKLDYELDEFNDLWEREFFTMTVEDKSKWESLGKNIENRPDDEVHVFENWVGQHLEPTGIIDI